MDGRVLEGMKVAILLTDDFEQVEMTEPKKVLDNAGARAVIVAPHGGSVEGMQHREKGDAFRVDKTLDEADPGGFDGVLIPGGALNADTLRMNEKARQFVREMDRTEKPTAVICHGPWLLVSAGLVKGRRMTSYHTIQDDIKNAGGLWEDSECVLDRNWVSSRSPADLQRFNREMVCLFSEYWAKSGKRRAA